MKFTIPPESSGLHGRIKGNCLAYIGNLGGDHGHVVSIGPEKNSRSLKQNATLYGVIYPPLMEFMGLSGERDREDLHTFMLGEYFGWNTIEIMGRKKQRPRRTTTTDENGKRDVLSKSDFIDFCEFIKRIAAEQGCFIPDPDPHHYLKDNNG